MTATTHQGNQKMWVRVLYAWLCTEFSAQLLYLVGGVMTPPYRIHILYRSDKLQFEFSEECFGDP